MKKMYIFISLGILMLNFGLCKAGVTILNNTGSEIDANIIGDRDESSTLKNGENYLKSNTIDYLTLKNLQEGKCDRIYVRGTKPFNPTIPSGCNKKKFNMYEQNDLEGKNYLTIKKGSFTSKGNFSVSGK
jgi:hypothetical protein